MIGLHLWNNVCFWFIYNQKDPKTGELEGVSYDFNICEAVATWEQVGFPYEVHPIAYLFTGMLLRHHRHIGWTHFWLILFHVIKFQ